MADCDYDGQSGEIDEFAMFRARALGAESEYQLIQQATRRGSPRPHSRHFHSNGSANDQYSSASASNNTTPVEGPSASRTSSGRRRHISGQGSGAGAQRSRRTAQGGQQGDTNDLGNDGIVPSDGAPVTSADVQVRRRIVSGRQQQPDRRTESTSSGGHRVLLSPGSFDDDGDVNGQQRPLQRTHSCRSTSRIGEKSATSADMGCPMYSCAVPSENIVANDNESGSASSKFNRNRTMTLPVRRRSSQRSSRPKADQSPQQQPPSFRPEPEMQTPDCTIGPEVAVYRVRTFTTKSGNVVNRGDSIKIRNRGTMRNGNNSTAAGIQRSSSSDSRPSSPGTKVGGWGGLAARDKREVLSRHSSHGARSSLSGDDAQFPVSPSASVGAAAALSSEQPLLDTERISRREQFDSAEVDVAELDRRGLIVGSEDRGTNGDTNENGVTVYGEPTIPVYKVLVLGSQGVGKTTLVEQLMTSEYLANKENCTTDDDSSDKMVSVQVDDEESLLKFIDIAGSQANKSRDLVDANLVIYSVTDRLSFQYAQSCLQELRPAKRHNVVILVANKQDIVRNRVISEEDGKSLAARRHCKFIEVSALLDLKMDELLVGITRQIRLRKSQPRAGAHGGITLGGDSARSATDGTAADGIPIGCLQRAAVAAFRKLFRRRAPIEATSCDDLFKP